jgi:hypothetical protein
MAILFHQLADSLQMISGCIFLGYKQLTFAKLVKNRASWYSSGHSRSMRKLIGVSREKNRSTTEELFRSSPLGSKSSTLTAYSTLSSGSRLGGEILPPAPIAQSCYRWLEAIVGCKVRRMLPSQTGAALYDKGLALKRLHEKKTYSGAYRVMRFNRDFVAR